MYKIHIFKKLVAILPIAVFLLGLMPNSVLAVNAANDYDIVPFENHAISDLGLSVYFSYSNITYTTDGTGIDYGSDTTSSLLFKLGSYQAIEVKTLSNIRFGVTDSETAKRTKDLSDFPSLLFKPVTTNQTSDDELFEFDYQKQLNLGNKFDMSSTIGTSTDYNTTLVNNAANSVNVTSDYAAVNKTLSELHTDFELEKGYFNNVNHRAKNAKYLTSVVGYENFVEGSMSDLKGFIVAVSGADYDDIRIQNVNLTSAHLTFNMSTKMKDFLKDVIDRALSNPDVVSSAALAKLNPRYKSSLFFDGIPFISELEKGVNTMVATFGTPLKQVGDSIFNALSGQKSGVGTVSDSVLNPIGSYYKTALSPRYNTAPAQVDITEKITASSSSVAVDTPLIDESVGVSTSIFDEQGLLSSNTLMIVGIVVVFFVLALLVIRYRQKISL